MYLKFLIIFFVIFLILKILFIKFLSRKIIKKIKYNLNQIIKCF